jgi:hypothetical protein
MPGAATAAGRPAAMQGYILTDAGPGGGTVGTSGTSAGAAVGTAGSTSSVAKTGATYHVSGIGEERLKPLVGKRVEVTGRMGDADARQPASASPSAAPDANRADRAGRLEFQASSIREMPGACPTPPANR